jgi:AcrR family transcriptional regulator
MTAPKGNGTQPGHRYAPNRTAPSQGDHKGKVRGGGTAGLRKARAAETATALKDAARKVFAERGYLNTKITDITAVAGRAAGSFYNHFASKEELLQALLTDLLTAADDTVGDPEHDPDFTARAAIRFHVAGYFAFYREHRTVMVALQQAAMVDKAFGARLAELTAPDLGHLAEHFEYVRRAGHELPGPPAQVAQAMAALLHGYASTYLDDPGDLTEEQAVDMITDLVHRGVVGRAP